MKIKLVTFAPHPNFGTCLQSYALNYVLREMGHDVEFIYNGRETAPPSNIQIVKRLITGIAKRTLPNSWIVKIKKKKKVETCVNNTELVILQLPNHKLLYSLSLIPGAKALYKWWKYDNLQKRKVYKFTFEDGNFNMRRIFTHKQYKEVTEDADMFITGSDQIWNPYCGGFNPMMFLEFADSKKRIAYSSSISQPEIPKIVEQRIKNDLSKFLHIAVREQKSVELLNNLLGRKDVKLVVDPTYLLSAEQWTEFGNRARIEFNMPDKYIFCYFVGEKRKEVYEQMVEDVKTFTGIEDVITLECYNRPLNYGKGRLYNDAGPYEWVYLLQHASYVCMDSFHATVFALKFQKEFVHAMKNEDNEVGSQNTRMYDILLRYGLLNKVYRSHNDTSWNTTIDYSKVTPIIESEIEDSMAYLKYEIEN